MPRWHPSAPQIAPGGRAHAPQRFGTADMAKPYSYYVIDQYASTYHHATRSWTRGEPHASGVTSPELRTLGCQRIAGQSVDKRAGRTVRRSHLGQFARPAAHSRHRTQAADSRVSC